MSTDTTPDPRIIYKAHDNEANITMLIAGRDCGCVSPLAEPGRLISTRDGAQSSSAHWHPINSKWSEPSAWRRFLATTEVGWSICVLYAYGNYKWLLVHLPNVYVREWESPDMTSRPKLYHTVTSRDRQRYEWLINYSRVRVMITEFPRINVGTNTEKL